MICNDDNGGCFIVVLEHQNLFLCFHVIVLLSQ